MSETKNPRIEIKTGVSGAFTEIFVDGHKIPGVRTWKLEHGRRNTSPVLTIDLNALNLSVDVPVLDIRHEELGTMEIEFPDGMVHCEDGKIIPKYACNFARRAGISEDKVLEFLNKNINETNKNG